MTSIISSDGRYVSCYSPMSASTWSDPEMFVFGLNHRTAPLEIRERFAVLKSGQADLVEDLHRAVGSEETVLLSTCNRWEMYGTASGLPWESVMERLLGWLARRSGLPEHEVRSLLYVHHGRDAFRQLVRVGAGLDSMVLGEAQIFGQVKDAYRMAEERHTAGPALRRIFSKAFSVVKRVRTETAIGQRPVSVSSVAVEVAEKIFGTLANRSVLLLGTGKISEVTARALSLRGASSIAVAGRQEAKAQAVADQACGWVLPWDQVAPALETVDIAMVATGAPHYLLTAERFRERLAARHGRPLLLVDLSVPRNVDPALANGEGVFLYDLDDLQAVAGRNTAARALHAAQAEAMVEQAVERWMPEERRESLIQSRSSRSLPVLGVIA